MPATNGVFPERDGLGKDPVIAWFRGEFAAANAIIDALCVHLRRLDPAETSRYESVFKAVHCRRLNWIPLIQNQQYFSIAHVTTELNKVADEIINSRSDDVGKDNAETEKNEKEGGGDVNVEESGGEGGGDQMVDEDLTSDVTDTGSQEAQPLECIALCSNHEECEARCLHIKAKTKFLSMESVKGHMVNVVKGLKLYEDVFTELELSKLNDLVDELRVSGRNGELSGKTFVLYNQQTKENRRELIQLGIPIFSRIKLGGTNESAEDCIEPMPALLEAVVDHLSQWHLISEKSKPNGCIINFFDEGEFSQPFLKPPHVEQPVTTLLLDESTMAFGYTFVNDRRGNYRGPLVLSLKKGSLLVMRGNSSSTARHAMCSSSNKRVSITFFRVQTDLESDSSPSSASDNIEKPSPTAMTLWQQNFQKPHPVPNTYDMFPKWGGLVGARPVYMLAPVQPVVAMAPETVHNGGGGTGVFLPRSAGTRKPARQLPPRARRLGQRRALNTLEETRDEPENGSAGSGVVESHLKEIKEKEMM